MNTKAKYIVMVQKAQGLVGNTHHDEKHMLTNYTLDRGSRGGSGCGGAESGSGMGSTNYGKRYKQDD